MGDACHVLLNDRPCVQFGSDVVTRGSDNLHTALPCLVIGFGTDEGWQERVVYINNMVRIGGNHLVADNLHVAGQDDERHPLLAQQLHLCLFHLLLIGVVLLDAPHVVGYAELLGHIAQVLMVGDDAGNVHIILSGLPPCQQVVETVAHLRDEDGHAGPTVAEVEAELHLVSLSVERVNIFADFLAGDEEAVQLPLYAHEEHAVLAVYILVKVNDVALVVGNKLGYLRDNALLVGAVEEKNGGRFHCLRMILL